MDILFRTSQRIKDRTSNSTLHGTSSRTSHRTTYKGHFKIFTVQPPFELQQRSGKMEAHLNSFLIPDKRMIETKHCRWSEYHRNVDVGGGTMSVGEYDVLSRRKKSFGTFTCISQVRINQTSKNWWDN